MPAAPCRRILQLTIAHTEETQLAWLDSLPNAPTLCAHVCLKGLSCKSKPVQTQLRRLHRVRVLECVSEAGSHAAGHEGVCAFRFLIDHYHDPAWEHVYFLHGDVNAAKHRTQKGHLLRYLSRPVWPAWPATRMAMTPEHCGCGMSGIRLHPFGPRDFWFTAVAWWFGTMLRPRDETTARLAEMWAGIADCTERDGPHVCTRAGQGAYPLHRGLLSSPAGFMFGVDRSAALQRSRRFFEAQYRLCRFGLRTLPRGVKLSPPAAQMEAPGLLYNPLVYGQCACPPPHTMVALAYSLVPP